MPALAAYILENGRSGDQLRNNNPISHFLVFLVGICTCRLMPITIDNIVGIPMMSISRSDLMPISSERSDAGLSQCGTVIDIRQDVSMFSCRGSSKF
jgi:hypothetical protein